MDENRKYEIIKGLANHPNSNKKRAALAFGCTVRHVSRLLAGYNQSGKEFFIHGNRGRRQPANTIQADTNTTVIDLYRSKYYDVNFTELLENLEDISISASSVSQGHLCKTEVCQKTFKGFENGCKVTKGS